MSLNTITLSGSSGSQVDVRNNALLTYIPDEVQGFSWTSATADIDAGDTALLVTNLSTSQNLHIARAYVYSDVHTQVLFTLPIFGIFTGTAVTGIPLNQSAKSVAPVTAWADETGNASGNVFARISTTELDTGQYGEWLELDGKVILGYRDSIGIDIVAESGAFYSCIIGYFRDK